MVSNEQVDGELVVIPAWGVTFTRRLWKVASSAMDEGSGPCRSAHVLLGGAQAMVTLHCCTRKPELDTAVKQNYCLMGKEASASNWIPFQTQLGRVVVYGQGAGCGSLGRRLLRGDIRSGHSETNVTRIPAKGRPG